MPKVKYINVISVLRGYSDSVRNADIETKKDEVKDIEEAPGQPGISLLESWNKYASSRA